jgi:hypothetical protein
MTLRMSVVGQTLTRSAAQRAKVNVLEFLSSNPELYEKLRSSAQLLESEVVYGIMKSCILTEVFIEAARVH